MEVNNIDKMKKLKAFLKGSDKLAIMSSGRVSLAPNSPYKVKNPFATPGIKKFTENPNTGSPHIVINPKKRKAIGFKPQKEYILTPEPKDLVNLQLGIRRAIGYGREKEVLQNPLITQTDDRQAVGYGRSGEKIKNSKYEYKKERQAIGYGREDEKIENSKTLKKEEERQAVGYGRSDEKVKNSKYEYKEERQAVGYGREDEKIKNNKKQKNPLRPRKAIGYGREDEVIEPLKNTDNEAFQELTKKIKQKKSGR